MKKGNEFFELLLQEVKLLLAGKRAANNILSDSMRSSSNTEAAVDKYLTSSTLKAHFKDPAVMKKIRDSLDAGETNASKAKEVDKAKSKVNTAPVAPERGVRISTSVDLDLDARKRNNLRLSPSAKDGNDLSSSSLPSRNVRSGQLSEASSPNTVKYTDIYPGEKNFLSTEAWQVYRGISQGSALHRSDLKDLSLSGSGGKGQTAHRNFFDTKKSRSPKSSPLGGGGGSGGGSPSKVVEATPAPRRKGGQTEEAVRSSSPINDTLDSPSVHDIKQKFETMIKKNHAGGSLSPSRRESFQDSDGGQTNEREPSIRLPKLSRGVAELSRSTST